MHSFSAILSRYETTAYHLTSQFDVIVQHKIVNLEKTSTYECMSSAQFRNKITRSHNCDYPFTLDNSEGKGKPSGARANRVDLYIHVVLQDIVDHA